MAGEVASGSQRIKRERDDQVITANYKIQDLTIEDAKEDTSYNAFAATLPAHAAFDKDLDVITGKAAALVEEVSEILKKHAGDSTVLKNMLARATDAMGTPKVEPPMIALLGDTGDGKSSLINSLSDVPNLARTGSDGSSCTSVPTLYKAKLPGQTQPFAAKIRYRTIPACRELLKKLWEDYKRGAFERPDEEDEEQENDVEMLASTALDAFVDMFCHKPEFKDRERAEESLKDEFYASQEGPLNKMVRWCEQHLKDLNMAEGAAYIELEADEAPKLEEIILPFTTSRSKEEIVSLWPLVQDMQVGSSASSLLEYITLVDLPGLWYIADIKRVITNPSLERAIGKYAERFPDSLAVVMTKTDLDIKSCKAAEDLCKEQGSWEDYHYCQQQLRDLKPKIRTATAKFRASLSQPVETQSRLESLDELEKQCAEAEIGLYEAMVNARNAHCTARLRQGKEKYLTPGATLNIFCVSNQHYEAHRNIDNVLQPLMGMKTTSIPALRTHALELAAPSLWLAKAEHIDYKFSVLFHGLKLWSKSSGGKDRSKMLLTVEQMQREVAAPFQMLVNQQYDMISQTLILKLSSGLNRSRSSALESLTFYEAWKPSTWRAFYRNTGEHRTPTKPMQSWNEEFLKHQTVKILNPAWSKLLKALETSRSAAVQSLLGKISQYTKEMTRFPESIALDKTAMEQMFKGIATGVESAFKKVAADCRESHRNIKLDATIDQTENYFVMAMTPAYEAGRDDKGKNVVKRCKGHLRTHLELSPRDPESPFAAALSGLSEALRDANKVHTLALSDRITEQLRDVYHQFTDLCRQKPETASEKAARGDIKNFLAEHMVEIEYIEAALENIRNKYPGC